MTSTSPISTGIDVNTIVSSLMETERLQLTKLSQSRNLYESQLNQYGKLNSLIKQFSDSLSNLTSTLNTNSYKVNSSDNSVVSTVLSTQMAAPGQHSLEITQLAKSHQLSSMDFSSRSDALGVSGTLDLSSGTDNFSLSIDSGDSLEKIRDNINISQNNQGISASILATTSGSGTPEFRLILSARETGVAHEIFLSGDASAQLDLTHVISVPKDAIFKFDGFDVTRSSNTISDLLDGITLTLNKESSTATIQILPDDENRTANAKTAITTLVNNYNMLIDLIDKNQSTSSLRDSTYSLVKMRLKNTLELPTGIGSFINVGMKTAAAVKLFNEEGVEYVSTGKLALDDTTMTQYLQNNFEEAKSFFSEPNSGFIAHFTEVLTDITKEGGNITSRQKIIKQQESTIDQRIGREESRLDSVKSSLIRRYSELNTFIQHYQQLSSFLEQQLDSLSNNRK
ncbi:MAG: flagellar filament capping protein FliD [Legionella sp.]|nr:flagellar filament capping protein FliD [Legionella sp.]